VIGSRTASFEVTLGIVPSVCLLIDIPGKIEDSFYHGKVF